MQLVDQIDQLLSKLNSRDNITYIIKLLKFLEQNHPESPTPAPDATHPATSSSITSAALPEAQPSEGKPKFYIRTSDSIKFAREQALAGRKVLIMDAANNQRPGAGPYETGTFEEALTRYSDLYWQAMTSFRDVEGKGVNVTDYQAKYFQSILENIRYSLEHPDKVGSLEFRKHFFESGGGISGGGIYGIYPKCSFGKYS